MSRRVHWEEYDRCERCEVPRGRACVRLGQPPEYGELRLRTKTPHQGRRHLTRAATEILREADQ